VDSKTDFNCTSSYFPFLCILEIPKETDFLIIFYFFSVFSRNWEGTTGMFKC